jgi:hypothetical protein
MPQLHESETLLDSGPLNSNQMMAWGGSGAFVLLLGADLTIHLLSGRWLGVALMDAPVAVEAFIAAVLFGVGLALVNVCFGRTWVAFIPDLKQVVVEKQWMCGISRKRILAGEIASITMKSKRKATVESFDIGLIMESGLKKHLMHLGSAPVISKKQARRLGQRVDKQVIFE